MTESVITGPSTEDPDATGDFAQWVGSLVGAYRPEYLVCIARGALRAVELLVPRDALPPSMKILSSDALPFVESRAWNDASVLVLDDSVIFGSTMADVVAYLDERGARVSCAAYVQDRETFLGESRLGAGGRPSPHAWLPLTVRYKRWSDGVRAHHAQLVERVLESPLDYNTDFPSLTVEVPPFQLGDLSFLAHLLRQVPGVQRVENVSHPMSVYAPTVRYTVLLASGNRGLFESDRDAWERGFEKCRVTVTPALGEIRLTPIVHLGLRATEKVEPGFTSPALHRAWADSEHPRGTIEARDAEANHRLVSSLAALIVGKAIAGKVSGIVSHFGEAKLSFDSKRLTPILGARNAELLARSWTELASEADSDVCARTSPPGPSIEPSALADEVAAVLLRRPPLKPSSADTPWECVGRVLLALREATDSTERRHAVPDSTRIRVGLTFEDICAILNGALGLGLARDDVSVALDMYVDSGLAVPKIVRRSKVWVRAFYSGENEENQPVLQLKRHLHTAYTKYVVASGSEDDEAAMLSRFDVTKLCVALKYIIPKLPISLAPDKYGFVPAPVHRPKAKPKWLYEGAFAPFKVVKGTQRTIVLPNDEFLTPVAPSWSNDQTLRFEEAFSFLAKAFTRLNDDPKLLLTTCRTHLHAFNAVAFEAHEWASSGESGFMLVASSLEALRNGTPQVTLGRGLYWSLRILSEARRKEKVFYFQFASLKQKLERAVTANGKDAAAARWWEWFERTGLLDPDKRAEIEVRWKRLAPVLSMMELLTGYTAGAMVHFGALDWPAFEKEFVKRGTSLKSAKFRGMGHRNWQESGRRYNEQVRSDGGAHSVYLETTLPVDDTATVDQACSAVVTAFREIVSALGAVCPRYKTEESAFPFAPAADSRVRDDGATEVRLDNHFILALDIVRSTGSSQTGAFRERVMGILRSLEGRGVLLQTSGDDCILACAPQARVLLGALKAIASEGTLAAGPVNGIGGARKAISYGSLLMIRRGEAIAFEEASPAAAIAQVTSMCGALDEHVKGQDINAFVMIEERTVQRAGAAGKGAFGSTRRVGVSSKHFGGFALVAEIAGLTS